MSLRSLAFLTLPVLACLCIFNRCARRSVQPARTAASKNAQALAGYARNISAAHKPTLSNAAAGSAAAAPLVTRPFNLLASSAEGPGEPIKRAPTTLPSLAQIAPIDFSLLIPMCGAETWGHHSQQVEGGGRTAGRTSDGGAGQPIGRRINRPARRSAESSVGQSAARTAAGMRKRSGADGHADALMFGPSNGPPDAGPFERPSGPLNLSRFPCAYLSSRVAAGLMDQIRHGAPSRLQALLGVGELGMKQRPRIATPPKSDAEARRRPLVNWIDRGRRAERERHAAHEINLLAPC